MTISRLQEHVSRYDVTIHEDVRPGELSSERWARISHACARKRVAKRVINERGRRWFGR